MNDFVEILLPQYEFYIQRLGEWIPSGNYVRGKITEELGDSAYRVQLYIKDEPEVIVYYKDLKFL